ncbi:MAG: hypothetical protein ACHQNT_06310 [Bacteroidia bacterium]
MEILLTLAYTAFFVFLIKKVSFFSIDGFSKNLFSLFFILKILSGFALSLIYTYYYTDRLTADTFKYFDDSKIIFDLFREDKKLFLQFMIGTNDYSEMYMYYSNIMNNWWNKYNIYNESRSIIRLNVMMRFVSMGYYQVHNVFFSFISFSGLFALARLFLYNLKDLKREMLLFVFLFPSVLFWSSGVMKDGIIFFVVGFSLYFVHKYFSMTRRKIFHFLCFLTFSILLFFTKLYVFFLLVPCLIAFYFSYRNKAHTIKAFVIIFSVYIVLLLCAKYIFPEIDFLQMLAEKQKEFIQLANDQKAGSTIQINELQPNIWSLLKNIPQGIFNSFFRPHFFDSRSPLILLSAFENFFIVLMMILVLFSMNFRKIVANPLFWFSAFFVVSLFALIGMMTPVLGALVRYKIQALPFLFFIFFTLAEKEKLRKRFPFMKTIIK